MYSLLISFSDLMTNIGYIIVALLILMIMIVIHEAGHYIAGKVLGFKINEFAVGFGPKLFSRTKKNGEVFSIRAIPLGGYCAFEGEDSEEDGGESHPNAFNNKPPWKRLIVLFSGALFNFISAIIIIVIYFSAYGQVLPVITEVYTDSAAYEAGFQKGDAFLEINGEMIHVVMPSDLTAKISEAGDSAEFLIMRAGEQIIISVDKADYTAIIDGENVSRYGFGFSINAAQEVKLGFGTALYRAIPFCFFVVWSILLSLVGLLTGAIGLENAGGPITIIDTISQVARYGFGQIMYILVILSANLAVMNLLPLPALDGSKMVFTTIEWVRGKPINRKIENTIHMIGLFLLFGAVIILDVMHLLS